MNFFSVLQGRTTPYFFAVVLFFSTSCSKNSDVADPFDPRTAKVLKDEAYGAGSLQKADVYLPADRNSGTKTMILIHGGFWTSGDKSEMDTLIAPIKASDPSLAIVNINYRLADGSAAGQHPAQMTDIQLLLDYIDSHAATWHIGNDYALTGVSSGGHLALLFAYGFDTKSQVKAVASIIGPTNFADPYYVNAPLFQTLATQFLGKSWVQDSALHKSVSPVNLVKSHSPPTFLAYGSMDLFVPISNPDALNARLTALGVPHQYIKYPNEGHDLSDNAIRDIIAKVTVFFNQYL